VAVRALASAGKFVELASVRVGSMAVRTFLKSQRLLEVAARVATIALHKGMFPEQGILGLGVIEHLIHL